MFILFAGQTVGFRCPKIRKSIFWEMIQVDESCSDGVKPPTSDVSSSCPAGWDFLKTERFSILENRQIFIGLVKGGFYLVPCFFWGIDA